MINNNVATAIYTIADPVPEGFSIIFVEVISTMAIAVAFGLKKRVSLPKLLR